MTPVWRARRGFAGPLACLALAASLTALTVWPAPAAPLPSTPAPETAAVRPTATPATVSAPPMAAPKATQAPAIAPGPAKSKTVVRVTAADHPGFGRVVLDAPATLGFSVNRDGQTLLV